MRRPVPSTVAGGRWPVGRPVPSTVAGEKNGGKEGGIILFFPSDDDNFLTVRRQ